jgi:hypothetical protein
MSANQKALSDISQYFSDVTVSFEKLVQSLSELPSIFDQSGKAHANESEFYTFWVELAQKQICPTKNFEEPTRQIRSEVADSLKKTSNDYMQRAQMLVQRGKDLIAKIKASEDANVAAYKAYEAAGKELKEAFNAKSPRLQEIRDNFVKMQEKAIQCHEQNNSARASASLGFEGILSDFEGLEIWRTESIRRALLNFAKAMHSIAVRFSENATEITQSLAEVDPTTDIKNLVFPKDVKNAISDDRFQLIPVLPQASKFVNTSVLFKSDVSKGARLMRAKEDFTGGKDELNVSTDEVVAVICDDGTKALCHNINESEGYLPLSILIAIN